MKRQESLSEACQNDILLSPVGGQGVILETNLPTMASPQSKPPMLARFLAWAKTICAAGGVQVGESKPVALH